MSQNNLVGQQLGQYVFRKLLGKGGMGEVYHAYDSKIKRDVAIKIILPQWVNSGDLLKRFTREAKTCAKLDHPNIVKVYDFGTKNQTTYMVLQFLTGGVLSDRIPKSSNKLLPISEVINWIKQISSALDYAHQMGVIHRDIKPANIMFDAHGRVYVVDFGIAKIKSPDEKGVTDLTKGLAIGTSAFMPPEQWIGDELTGQADQYALAVMTYQLLCGKLPFEADNFHAFMHKHRSVTPSLLSELRRDISPDVDNVMMRALAKDPQHRFNTCTEFALALEQAIYGHLPNLNNDIPAIQNNKPQEKKSNFVILSLIGSGVASIIILLMILSGGTDDNATVIDDTSQTLTITNSQDTPLTATYTISLEEMARVTIERMETQTSEALALVSTATIMPSNTPTVTPSDT
ncbi:MAG: serine/threonine protein kinase, partial [Anaerolineae bacterium]|nr:serine/threonine protein kinase [Anaerolineae bacterium]